MGQKKPYIVLISSTGDSLEKKVYESIDAGYILFGNLIIDEGLFFQAMILPGLIIAR